jgi:PAS domain S-box-containing protein
MTTNQAGETSPKFGVDIVGEIPWGTHLCQFYRTKKDLTDVLVPYFGAGLANNEFCMWVTSQPLEVEEAKEALRKAVPNLEERIRNGKIEILSYVDWYLVGGRFDADRVLDGLVRKEKAALSRGSAGLRFTGNTFWIERGAWKSFVDYEEKVNEVIGSHRMIALCTYSLAKCTGSDVVDVMRNHAGTLIRRRKTWNLVEDALQRKKSEEEIRRIAQFPSENPDPVLRVAKNGVILYSNASGFLLLKEWGREVGQRVPTRWQQLIDDALRSGSKIEFEETCAGKVMSHVLVPFADSGYVNLYGRDVTKHRQNENELRETRDYLENLLNYANSPIIVWDPQFRITMFNHAFERMTGLSSGDVIGKRLDIFFPEDRKEAALGYIKRTVKGEYWQAVEIPILHRDGSVRIALWNSANIYDVSGRNIVATIAQGQDITERKKAEDDLRESQADLNRAQSVAHTGSWRLDMQRDVLVWSEETYRMFGIPKETPMTYEKFLVAVHPDDRAYVDEKWEEALNGERYDVEHRIVVNGTVKWVRERAELEFGKDGLLLGGFGTVQDVTERKQSENELRETRDYLNNLLNYANAPIIVWDPQSRITMFNHAFEHLTGLSSGDIVGKQLDVLFPKDRKDEALAHIQRTLAGEYWESVEIPIQHRDGTVKTALWNSANIHDPTSKAVVATIAQGQDITERKRLEEMLKNAERMAAIGETAAMVGHDLRNPLQAIVGEVALGELALETLPTGTAEKERLTRTLEAISSHAVYMDKIVSDLRAYAGPIAPKFFDTDLRKLVNETLAMLSIPENVEVSVVIPNDFPMLWVDSSLLRRVLVNLITNALQAMPTGGKLSIEAMKDAESDSVRVSVEDTGIGISEEDRPYIFKPLFTRKSKGQGFGLPVCRRLVEAHNGMIVFESEVGKGTKFTVRLPQRKNK